VEGRVIGGSMSHGFSPVSHNRGSRYHRIGVALALHASDGVSARVARDYININFCNIVTEVGPLALVLHSLAERR